jgi:hypothetical protein
MHIELLVEELSTEAAIRELLPKIVGSRATWATHPHQGKKDLLSKLPRRLKGYAKWLPDEWLIVVLIDEDRQDCRKLKQYLERTAKEARLATSTSPGAGGRIQVVNRIAVEELEAWFFGDVDALSAAYPGVSPTLASKEKYRNPDTINGGTWEALERVLQKAGYFKGGLAKIEVARCVAKRMDPARNLSRSFRHFRDALLSLVSSDGPRSR